MSQPTSDQAPPVIIHTEEYEKVIRCRALIRSYIDPFLSSQWLSDEFGFTASVTIRIDKCPASEKAVNLERQLLEQTGHIVALSSQTTHQILMEIHRNENKAEEQDATGLV